MKGLLLTMALVCAIWFVCANGPVFLARGDARFSGAPRPTDPVNTFPLMLGLALVGLAVIVL